MPLAASGKNSALDGLGITHLSVHTAIPDGTGSNEASGGSPAYARKAVTFNSASGGTKDKNATDPVFDLAAGTYVAIGFWDAASAGNFKGWAPINGGDVDGVGTAKASGDAITSHAHGLSNGDRVALTAVAEESLPTGLNATTLYHVVNATADTFQLALTAGGAAVDITADGELAWQKVVPEVFGAQGTLTVDTLTLSANFL